MIEVILDLIDFLDESIFGGWLRHEKHLDE